MNYKDIKGFEEWLFKSETITYAQYLGRWIDSQPETCKLALLQEYLREEKGMNVYVSLSGTEDITWFWSVNDVSIQRGSFESYNEALIEGIEQGIKLIEK